MYSFISLQTHIELIELTALESRDLQQYTKDGFTKAIGFFLMKCKVAWTT